MTKQKAIKRLKEYLNAHFIHLETDFDNGTPRFTMIFKNCNNCHDKILESCVYFYQDCMEVKTHFTQNAASWCKGYQQSIPMIMRFLNYIKATVWMSSSDGANGLSYNPSILYTPRIFMPEDECYDITITRVSSYFPINCKDDCHFLPRKKELYCKDCSRLGCDTACMTARENDKVYYNGQRCGGFIEKKKMNYKICFTDLALNR